MDESGEADPVVLPESLLARYRKFSLYNSPYPAHDRACAVDLYPASNAAVSPVAGEVLDTRTVGCPDREYAVDHDHLIVIDTGEQVARVLHVDPAVEAGDEVAVGDALGELVRSGFFGRWVDNHVHLEFRDRTKNPYRASGSLPLVAGAAVTALSWDGTGTVVETGPSHAVLDTPMPPSTDDDAATFTAIAADDGRPLDGVTVEIWQCDAQGVYKHVRAQSGGDPHFQGFGRTVSGSDGGYRFRTIRPVPYGGRTPHIHFKIKGRGIAGLTTQLYIAGHPMNARDFIFSRVPERLRDGVTAAFEPDADGGPARARFDIVLGPDFVADPE